MWALALALLATGCASLTGAPKGWLPERDQLDRSTRGGWIEVLAASGDSRPALQGELISVDDDGLSLLTKGGLELVPFARVGKVRLQTFEPGSVAGLTAAGTLSTLSHGVFLLLTAPLWIATAVAAQNGEYRSALIDFPPATPLDLRPFARFPQGYPKGLAVEALGSLDLNSEELGARARGRPTPGKTPQK